MGCRQNPRQKKFTMTDITEGIRQKFGIQWAFYGFKQSDSMNRRIMLRGKEYEMQAINRKTMKCYPLSAYHNSDVLAYIRKENLITPECYGKGGQSSGTNITDLAYLLYLRQNYPDDLGRVFALFPLTERILFEHDYGKEESENQ